MKTSYGLQSGSRPVITERHVGSTATVAGLSTTSSARRSRDVEKSFVWVRSLQYVPVLVRSIVGDAAQQVALHADDDPIIGVRQRIMRPPPSTLRRARKIAAWLYVPPDPLLNAVGS